MSDGVVLAGSCWWWAENARVARWGERDVVAWVGPRLGQDPAIAHTLHERAAAWIGRHDPHILTLLAYIQVDGQPVWLYPPPDGVSVGAILRAERDGLPIRVALELCAEVAESVLHLGPAGVAHVGPEPDHVLVSPSGRVVLTHLPAAAPRKPVRREPHGREDETAAVWRLGVLLAELLTGHSPQAATDPSSAEASERRLMIRLLARPGAVVPPAIRTWLQALLAWESRERPPLLRVAPGLREVAAGLDGPNLGAWSQQRVPSLRVHAVRQPSNPPPPPEQFADDPVVERTEEVGDLPERDDETAISTDGEVSVEPRTRSEQGTIPVAVGPPVEVLRRLRGLEAAREQTRTLTLPTAMARMLPGYRWLVGGTLAAFAMIGLVAIWLLWG